MMISLVNRFSTFPESGNSCLGLLTDFITPLRENFFQRFPRVAINCQDPAEENFDRRGDHVENLLQSIERGGRGVPRARTRHTISPASYPAPKADSRNGTPQVKDRLCQELPGLAALDRSIAFVSPLVGFNRPTIENGPVRALCSPCRPVAPATFGLLWALTSPVFLVPGHGNSEPGYVPVATSHRKVMGHIRKGCPAISAWLLRNLRQGSHSCRDQAALSSASSSHLSTNPIVPGRVHAKQRKTFVASFQSASKPAYHSDSRANICRSRGNVTFPHPGRYRARVLKCVSVRELLGSSFGNLAQSGSSSIRGPGRESLPGSSGIMTHPRTSLVHTCGSALLILGAILALSDSAPCRTATSPKPENGLPRTQLIRFGHRFPRPIASTHTHHVTPDHAS